MPPLTLCCSGASAAARALGVVPLRVWLITGYLLLLHLVVMISFTRRVRGWCIHGSYFRLVWV